MVFISVMVFNPIMALKDIEDLQDIEVVLRSFYPKAFADPIIGFMFTDVAKADLEEHVSKVKHFWNKAMFNKGDYDTNVLKKHTDLSAVVPLKAGHFTRWLYLFEKAIDDNFSGENAEQMRKRAHLIADSINGAIAAVNLKASGELDEKAIRKVKKEKVSTLNRDKL